VLPLPMKFSGELLIILSVHKISKKVIDRFETKYVEEWYALGQ